MVTPVGATQNLEFGTDHYSEIRVVRSPEGWLSLGFVAKPSEESDELLNKDVRLVSTTFRAQCRDEVELRQKLQIWTYELTAAIRIALAKPIVELKK